MIEGIDKIAMLIYAEKDNYILNAKKKMHPPYFDDIDIEMFVDDVIISVLKTPQAKKGFEDKVHIKKYMNITIVRRANKEFFIKRRKLLEECTMTDNQRARQFQLAKQIIDSNRLAGKK